MLALLRAYVEFEKSHSIPKEIERVVAAAFERYLAGGGKVSLDEAFGLTGRQRAGHPIEKQERFQKNILAMLEVARLQVVDGLTIEEAVSEVAGRDSKLKSEILQKEYKTHGVGKSLRDAIRRDRKGRPDE